MVKYNGNEFLSSPSHSFSWNQIRSTGTPVGAFWFSRKTTAPKSPQPQFPPTSQAKSISPLVPNSLPDESRQMLPHAHARLFPSRSYSSNTFACAPHRANLRPPAPAPLLYCELFVRPASKHRLHQRSFHLLPWQSCRKHESHLQRAPR